MERQYDLVIIGAGPAGLSAALYGSRAGLKTLILENGAPGGKLIKTNKISNYPGVKEIEGTQLAMDMFEQATSFQAEYAYGEVNKIDEELIKIRGDSYDTHALDRDSRVVSAPGPAAFRDLAQALSPGETDHPLGAGHRFRGVPVRLSPVRPRCRCVQRPFWNGRAVCPGGLDRRGRRKLADPHWRHCGGGHRSRPGQKTQSGLTHAALSLRWLPGTDRGWKHPLSVLILTGATVAFVFLPNFPGEICALFSPIPVTNPVSRALYK